jgi:uncharacterized protein (TIGR02246 family)
MLYLDDQCFRANKCALATLVFFCWVFLPNVNAQDDAAQLRQVLETYRTAWLENDSARVIGCFSDDGIISPNGNGPLRGKKAIRDFWFPSDSSETTIHRFEMVILESNLADEQAYIHSKTWLDWSYRKGKTRMGKVQQGFATTLLKKQPDGRWKIQKQNWTDVWSKTKTDDEIGRASDISAFSTSGETYTFDKTAESAMAKVIALDDFLGKLRNRACQRISLSETIRNYTEALALLDFTTCPADFRSGFEQHRLAWLKLLPFTDRYPDLRGEMHSLFSKMENDDPAFKQAVKHVWDTWALVEAAMK